MTSPTFANTEKRAGFRAFLHRQLFEKPALPENVDLEGKTAIVTGSNTGIGLECARQLLDLGLSKLVLAVRNETKGQKARDELARAHPSRPEGAIEVWKLDMEVYASVAALAERAKTLARLDLVVLNAGVAKAAYKRVAATGHEETVQVNVLSTGLLAILLLPVVKAKCATAAGAAPGRIAVVQSDTASWARFREKRHAPLLPALDDEKQFDRVDRYFTSKLLLQLFVTELARRVPASAAVIAMPNPGWTYGTGLGRGGGTVAEKVMAVPNRLLGRTPSAAARVVTTGAVGFGAEAHGQYIEDGKLQP